MNQIMKHDLRIGEFLVSVVNDGEMTVSLDLLSGIEVNAAKQMQSHAGVDCPNRLNINAYLIQGFGKTILVDSGTGGLNGAGGNVLNNLHCMGISPDDIDVILLTHAHPDHIGGLLDQEGHAIYKNAELYLHTLEFEYWMDDAQFKQANERSQRNFALVRRTLAAYANALNFLDTTPILKGIRPKLLAGHTPGHTGFYIESDDKSLLIWGDTVHFPNIQLIDPSISIAFDVDPQQAITTRKEILAQVVKDKQLIAGMHIEKQGFAQISQCKSGYHIRYMDL